MVPTEDLLRAALITALNYHPLYRGTAEYEEYRLVLLKGWQLKSIMGVVGDTFANIYTTIMRFPPQDYQKWAAALFADVHPSEELG